MTDEQIQQRAEALHRFAVDSDRYRYSFRRIEAVDAIAAFGRACRDEALGWQPLDYDDLPQGPVLVTNNLQAVNAHGRMSHVWCVDMVQKSIEPDAYPREVVAFTTSGWAKLHNLTHYAPVPLPAPPAAATEEP